MKSTSQLKIELTDQIDKVAAQEAQLKETKRTNRINGYENNLSKSQQFPPGVKCHIYEELNNE